MNTCGLLLPSFGQQFLDIAVAQGEAEMESDRVLDDLGAGADGGGSRADPCRHPIRYAARSRPGFRDNAQVGELILAFATKSDTGGRRYD
jgi:hypothetical protein